MKFSILFLILNSSSFFLSAKAADCYRLYLTDKEGADYCALSQRAMQRRERQGIELDERDRNLSSAYLQKLREEGFEIMTRSRWLNTVVVCWPDDDRLPDADYWKQFAFVSRAQKITGAVSPSLVNASAQARRQQEDKWEVEHLQGDEPTEDHFRAPIQEVHGEALHYAGYRGQNMLIAVLDGGYAYMDNMPGNIASKVEGWYDCYDHNGIGLPKMFDPDCSTHGTKVLSILATDTLNGVWGTAPEARYYLIRTEYGDSETQLEEDMWVEGAEYADSIGADLINSSLGYHTFDDDLGNATWDELCQGTQQISCGAAVACQKGILVCNSAGNDRARAWQKVGFPADVEEVFTIGATDANLQPGYFTSVGWLVPYVKPDVSCRGVHSWLMDVQKGIPSTGNGTSFSCPFLCGLMASLWSAAPQLTPSQLREAVRQSSSMSQSPDSLSGYGIPDFVTAMRILGISSTSIPECEAIEGFTEETLSRYDLWGNRFFYGAQNGRFIVQNGKKYLHLKR